MNGQKNIAVIILNWNGEKLLEEYLPKVIETTSPELAHIIVADNGSTDNSIELLRTRFPEVEVWAFPENYGFAEGYNRAIALAGDYEYSVLLNSDVAPAPGWIEPLKDYMDSHPKIGACQPKVLSYREPGKFEYAGASGGFLDKNGYPYCRGRIFATCEEDQGQYETPIECHWATGACLFIRTALYEEVGGLDPEFFAHMEEIDLCWRLRLKGYGIATVPQSIVYHLGGGSLPAENPRKTYLNFRNNLLMLHKNLPQESRKKILLRRRILDGVAWLKYILTFDLKNAKAILKAHRDYRRMRRDPEQNPGENLLGGRNILTDYYIHGHKTFSSL